MPASLFCFPSLFCFSLFCPLDSFFSSLKITSSSLFISPSLQPTLLSLFVSLCLTTTYLDDKEEEVKEEDIMSSSSAAKNAIMRSNKMIANVCVVNAGRLDFDGKLNLHSLSQALGLSLSSGGGGGEENNNVNKNKNMNTLTAHQDSSPSPDVVAERSEGHNCIVTKEIEIDIDLLPTSVKLICEAGTGFNNIDIEKAKKRGIRVTNVPEYSTEAMSHLVITSILNSSASMIKQQKMLERNERAHFTNFSGLPHFELEGKKVGLIGGNGTIGKRVCELAKAFRMKPYVYSRSAKAKTELYDVYQSLEELLSESDFVSVHCPLNDATRGMLDYEKLSLMKPTSYLINTARGAICNEEDLIQILKEKKIAGACLDVQTKEPPDEDSLLWNPGNVFDDNVTLTPHIGWKRVETRQRLIDSVAERIKEFVDGEDILNVVNQ